MDKKERNLWVDYLRSTMIVLVIAHHSSLAYTTFAWFDKNIYAHSTHPIVDGKRWIGLDVFENFNDIFFMSLLFFIGGLFLNRSIAKKGIFLFIKDRFFRLFIPFFVPGTLLMLLTCLPSYHLIHPHINMMEYLVDFFTTEQWPAGPFWFIGVLFAFNLIFSLLYHLFKKIETKSAPFFSYLMNRPFVFFVFLFFVTWLLYVPLAYNFGAGTWVGFGPFDFQLSRIFLYFGYFLIGIFIGCTDFNQGIFSINARIIKRWWLWTLLAFCIYTVLTVISDPLTQFVKAGVIKGFYAWMIYYILYAASCTISFMAFITVFRKYVTKQKRWMNSLSANAYLIYLIHFVFVIWLQYLLLDFNIPAFFKFVVTFAMALSLSWIVSCFLRKNKLINKYI